MRLETEEIAESVAVTVKRIVRAKTADLDYAETEQALPLSPATARVYRRNPNRLRQEGPQGTNTAQMQIIASFEGLPPGAILKDDILYLPACRATAGVPERALVQQVRAYPTGLQCDIEFGVQQKDRVEVV